MGLERGLGKLALELGDQINTLPTEQNLSLLNRISSYSQLLSKREKPTYFGSIKIKK